MIRRLLGSFTRRENEVLSGILSYGQEVALTAAALRDLIEGLVEGRESEISEAYRELMEREARADFTRRRLSEEISRGSFLANVRELLLELVERMDKIADYSKDAGRLLYLAAVSGVDFVPLLRSEPLQKLLHCQSQCIDSLLSVLRNMAAGRKIALEELHVVEEWEEEADEHKDDAIRGLFERKGSMNPADFVLMREFVLLLDSVCDAAEDSSDVLLNVIAVSYG
ncbi:MAG: DUF47 family protein [Nitrososphaerota archaeon]|nr:DUF47 family protein [Candidatus Calditenuis fumarioli]